ncbi:hybrid sensor histidine kinase/response regulator [Aquimarina sp. W85]|uniref:hybrid sensor histidine kinase/response regulator n=1 Tax=Aquimarina rhodophyticola TaxID=3342246 RepID=UPI0036732F43
MNSKGEVRPFHQKTQHISIQYDGIITFTEGALFKLKKGMSLYDMHPFFEIIPSLVETREDSQADVDHNFACIHLNDADVERICDITLTISAHGIELLIFDYTYKYSELHAVAQQKNESILLARALELRNKFLLEKEEFKNSFIANINHEIRTPLTSILGFVEILEKTKLDYEQEELARIIKRESLHLNALIDDMIDISVIESGRLKLAEERFSLKKLLQGFEKTYKKVAANKGITFHMSYEDTISDHVIGDPTRVYQIINNLLNNAFKFTEEGTVKLTVSKNYQRGNKTSISFKIEDTGSGIFPENLDHIFDRFSRFSQDKKIAGTGLGLAIVKNLIDVLQGDIKVSSEVNKGSIFSLKLPFTIEITNKSPARKKKTYTLPVRDKKFRILVIEDEESTQYLVMKLLIKEGDFFIDVAMNEEMAINFIEKRVYDLILMDLQLPHTNGYNITKTIRNDYGDTIISEIPIIGFTANAKDGERERCLKAGMDDFITKPFKQQDLLDKITKQIAKKAAR